MNEKAATIGFGPQGTVYRANVENGQMNSTQGAVSKIKLLDPVEVPISERLPKSNRKKPYKPVRFAEHTPLEGYYNDGHGNLYSVARLVDMCKDLEPFDAPLQSFDLSAPIWTDYSIFDLAFHIKAVNDADLDYPIILDWNGSIADGRHRLIKALTLGHSTIKCVRMYWKPEADKQI